MSNVLILNAHHYYPFAEGKLNHALVEKARRQLEEKGHDVRVEETNREYDVDEELANHQWADVIILQSPVNWMGVPWSFKKYMDEVYTAGMDGRVTNGDGRSADDPVKNYGAGGTLAAIPAIKIISYITAIWRRGSDELLARLPIADKLGEKRLREDR